MAACSRKVCMCVNIFLKQRQEQPFIRDLWTTILWYNKKPSKVVGVFVLCNEIWLTPGMTQWHLRYKHKCDRENVHNGQIDGKNLWKIYEHMNDGWVVLDSNLWLKASKNIYNAQQSLSRSSRHTTDNLKLLPFYNFLLFNNKNK